ncbi:hypothetical protein IC232_08315 [Microvirga sp. BT688]|uniref:hypothetical protein n=1 Tax=Microvirga sp. TaxID=1873136 RepID=UPI00168921D5|nr:hypothetical protein [Microvirga sp.]MBD2746701.1 hypothetical protein [Microvirga sp.]
MAMQSAVYLLLMNTAVLFGVLTLVKDHKDTPIVQDIGKQLIHLPVSSMFAVLAYFFECFCSAPLSVVKITQNNSTIGDHSGSVKLAPTGTCASAQLLHYSRKVHLHLT